MKAILHLILIVLLLVTCKNVRNTNIGTTSESQLVDDTTISVLPPLESGEIFFKSINPFGKTIELSGKQITGDTAIFNINGMAMHAKDDYLVAKSRLRSGYFFMLFDRSTLKLLKTFGRSGQGPDEFIYPELVPTDDPALLAYAFETTNQKLYSIDRKGQIQTFPFDLSTVQTKRYSDKQLVNLDENTFIYVETTSLGKGIFKAERTNDSTYFRKIYNLALNPKRKNDFAYIGDFVVNHEKNRMVYAYKYFKILKFMDLDAETVRIINFERDTFDETSPYKVDGLDANVTHYWGACAQPEYVYLLYSGRTPYEVTMENNKQNYYIFVEQYDWNGNPVRKFKLDQWGYFTVDESREELILASTNDDEPFFVYSLP